MMLLSLGAGLLDGALAVWRRPTRDDLLPPVGVDGTTTVTREPNA